MNHFIITVPHGLLQTSSIVVKDNHPYDYSAKYSAQLFETTLLETTQHITHIPREIIVILIGLNVD